MQIKDNIGKILIIIIIIQVYIILRVCGYPLAYLDVDRNAQVPIKFYDEDINKTECYKLINNTDLDYLKGVPMVHVWSNRMSGNTRARYYNSGLIQLFQGCNKIDWLHEVSHNIQSRNIKINTTNKRLFYNYYIDNKHNVEFWRILWGVYNE